ncbi:hypothetical protein I6L35_20400 [Aeromonas sp. FDAARGOS 1405]|uniref:hypothetical protein n=1 Tax=unclassified Aeromonas TaxID=257493 RepID=UPI001C24995D|nr:hypothetical protein [Aeromonas sp. FDAARGOS 1405]QXB29595.1 hypothetical protein I6L35_20400 [Aeromonas sp. FDAARGOS 1405]
MSEPHKDDTMSAIQLIEKGDEDDFLHKPIVPQDPDIATQSGSFANSFPMFHYLTLVSTKDRAEFNVLATLF